MRGENMSKWEEVASVEAGYCGQPGSQYHTTNFTLERRGNRYRVKVDDDWGSNQGYNESHGGNETEGRGDSPAEACEAVRRDVFAWVADDEKWRADYATALRQLCYQAEDAEEDNE